MATAEDDFLASVTSKSLSIGPNDVNQSDMTAYLLPMKTHQGLYSNSLADCVMEPPVDDSEEQKGVPGFPDFPAFWVGEEGSIRQQKEKWKDAILKNKMKRQHRRCRKMRRNAINHVKHRSEICSSSIGKQQKLWIKKERRKKKINTLLKMERKKNARKEMVSLKQAMSSLKF